MTEYSERMQQVMPTVEWPDANVKQLCDQIRQISYDIHVFFGPGFFEKIYKNSLTHRLHKAGILVDREVPAQVMDEDGFIVGDGYLDFLIHQFLVVEAKAVSHLTDAHIAQVLGYLRATNLTHGLLINFGSHKFEIRKFINRPLK